MQRVGGAGAHAVGAPRGLVRIGGGGGVDVDVLWQVLEHRARLARLEVEDELLVHGRVAHLLQGVNQLLGVHHRAREADDAHAAVVDKVDEDARVGAALEHLARSHAVDAMRVAGEHSHKVVGGHVVPRVVDDTALVDIDALGALGRRLVEELAREGVLLVVGNVVGREHDDLLRLHPRLDHDLVGVADIGLVAVVAVAGRASYEDSPVVALAKREPITDVRM